MMNSTPLNALNRNEEQDPNTREMVENIVNEIDDGASALPPGDPRGSSYQPSPQYEEEYQGGMEYGPPDQGRYGGGGRGYDGRGYDGGYQMPPQQQPQDFMKSFGGSLTDKFAQMAKDPAIVAGIFFLLSNTTVASMIESYVPYSYGPMMGLTVRALIAGVLFLFIKMFVVAR